MSPGAWRTKRPRAGSPGGGRVGGGRDRWLAPRVRRSGGSAFDQPPGAAGMEAPRDSRQGQRWGLLLKISHSWGSSFVPGSSGPPPTWGSEALRAFAGDGARGFVLDQEEGNHRLPSRARRGVCWAGLFWSLLGLCRSSSPRTSPEAWEAALAPFPPGGNKSAQ